MNDLSVMSTHDIYKKLTFKRQVLIELYGNTVSV